MLWFSLSVPGSNLDYRFDFISLILLILTLFEYLILLILYVYDFCYFCVNFRKDCFDSKMFGECVKVLLTPTEEISNLQHFIKVVNGSPISFNMQNT